jgi:hypothetical protein
MVGAVVVEDHGGHAPLVRGEDDKGEGRSLPSEGVRAKEEPRWAGPCWAGPVGRSSPSLFY